MMGNDSRCGDLARSACVLPVILLALLACGCRQEQGAKPLSPAEFAEAFCRKLEAIDSDLSVEKRGELELRLKGGEHYEEQMVFLNNAYNEYQLSPEALEEVLDRYARSVLETVRTADSVDLQVERIVPVIRDADYPVEVRKSLIERGHKADQLDLYYETLNERLLVFYALDTEHNIKYLSKSEIDSLEVDREQLRQTSIENLLRILPEIQRLGDGGVFIVTAGGNYEASLLLCDSIWSPEKFPVRGDFVVAIPSRDLLLVTGSNDAEGIETVRKIVQEAMDQGSYALTPELFVRSEGKWLLMKK